MKKIIGILVAAVFVMGFAASAFAIHAEIPAETQAVVATGGTQITIGGELRTRGWYTQNLDYALGKLPSDYRSSSWYDQRVRLSVDAKVSPNVQGFIQLESEGTGFDNTNDKYIWGTSAGNSGFGNAKPKSDPDFLQAWILYTGQGLFGVPAGLKIGHMPLKLSYGQFFDHTQMGDDALVLFVDPTKQMHIGLLTIKLNEGLDVRNAAGNDYVTGRFDNTDDLDAYVALMTYKFSDAIKAGINYTYLNDPDFGFSQQNLGVHADGKIGNFGYKAQVDFQFGKIFKDVSPALEEGSFKGYAASINADYNLDPVTLRGSFIYGSGESELGDDGDIKEFVPHVGNIQNYSFIYEYQMRTTAFNKTGLNPGAPSNGHASGVANTTYVNLGADWKATKDVTLSLDGYYFWATKTGAFEDLNSAANAVAGADIFETDVSSTAGWEIDAKIRYQIAKNLFYQIDAGYFDAGSFYGDAFNIDEKGVTSIRHLLQLNF